MSDDSSYTAGYESNALVLAIKVPGLLGSSMSGAAVMRASSAATSAAAAIAVHLESEAVRIAAL